MREMADRLRDRPGAGRRPTGPRTRPTSPRRDALGRRADDRRVSAGGMPDRVKCLHVLVAHALAAGPGVNPLGDEALAGSAPGGPPGRACRRRGGAVTRVAAIDCGTNSIRLLVADVPRRGRARPTCCGGWGSSGSARASTAPAGSRPRRSSAPAARSPTTPAMRARARCERGADGRHQRHPRRRQPRRLRAMVQATLGPSPRSSRGARRPSCPSSARPPRWTLPGRARHRRRGRRSWSSTSAAGPPSSCWATPAGCARRGRWTSAACG